MTARLAVVALLLVALAGCAKNSPDKPAPKNTPGPSQLSDPANEPFGRLSPAEKRVIVREYRQLKPLSQGKDSQAELERGRRACSELTQPGTELVARVRTDCDNAIAFFGALRGLEHAGDECGGGSERDRLECVRERLLAVARAIDKTTTGASAINVELRQRGITGLCARSIGITDAQLAAYHRAELAARRGADALTVGDSEGLQQATTDLSDALSADSGGDPLRGIERGCQTSKRKPLPSVPDGGGIGA